MDTLRQLVGDRHIYCPYLRTSVYNNNDKKFNMQYLFLYENTKYVLLVYCLDNKG